MSDHQSDDEVRNGNTALLQKLASAVNGHAAIATFACGGSVPLSDLSTGSPGPLRRTCFHLSLSDATLKTRVYSNRRFAFLFLIATTSHAKCSTVFFIVASLRPLVLAAAMSWMSNTEKQQSLTHEDSLLTFTRTIAV